MAPSTTAQFRTAVDADIPILLDLYAQLLDNKPSGSVKETGMPQWAREALLGFKGSHSRLYVLEDEGKVVGTLVLVLVPGLAHGGRPWAEVEHVVITDTVRGKGYGKLLMEHAERLAKAANCYKLQLMSSNYRTAAHGFYEGIGYKQVAKGFRKYF